MSKKLLLLSLLLFNLSFAQEQLPLIPQPKSILLGKGSCTITAKTTIQAAKNSFEANYLKEVIKAQTGLDLMITSKNSSNSIQLILKSPDATNVNKEHYELSSSRNKIVITAFSNQGILYGIQTLSQLLPLEKSSEIRVPWMNISDEPKYAWRGMHLDCARHFFPKEFIKKYIDYLAMYKMNTFHWHLTDDQGWRIEIKKIPKTD
ncbi:family 20 glycosylhydrolase [Flavobacterium macrobrachii]|uniref:family 20 glycosylhydrolase n=1 Tax=Flavobacterium macrobrachii TaxID=591204 RepID=UPI001FCF8FD3|nr:family 20 glycosylhydrolase [Flavobacterium macrobrachii]